MERRSLGDSDLALTPIGLGAWAIGGGDWVFGWGPQNDAESVATIRRAVDDGINWIDTAAVYGLGHSEAIVARALRDIPPRRRPYVFTKCSLTWDEDGNISHSLRPESIRREAEASLRRLEVECIDLYQIHWPLWPDTRLGDRPDGHDSGALEEAWATMAALRQEGKVRHVGISNADADQLARLQRIAPVTSLQPPYLAAQARHRGPHLAFLPDSQHRCHHLFTHAVGAAGGQDDARSDRLTRRGRLAAA